ncbi:hypothetical protein RIF29_27326 [Crotalaria pallida]|uniref:WRKY domain-containing protein n=1 Tax=Crotalaria pallida TaxID=3830 RepID=A0AAN9HYN0_CROPI
MTARIVVYYILRAKLILCFHINGTKMTDKNERPAYSHSPDIDDFTNQWSAELSEYLNLEDSNEWLGEDDLDSFVSEHVSSQQVYQANVSDFGGGSSIDHFEGSSTREISSGSQKKVRERFSFKTKSEVEILDDGYKWRKYGKKMVKNSPNPRHYYRCSVEGCPVKKTVDRDKDDPRYVITTYEGVHTHPSSW